MLFQQGLLRRGVHAAWHFGAMPAGWCVADTAFAVADEGVLSCFLPPGLSRVYANMFNPCQGCVVFSLCCSCAWSHPHRRSRTGAAVVFVASAPVDIALGPARGLGPVRRAATRAGVGLCGSRVRHIAHAGHFGFGLAVSWFGCCFGMRGTCVLRSLSGAV